MKLTKVQVLIAGFLHDIGKAIERCKYFPLTEEFNKEDTKYAHPKYSAQLLKVLKTDKDKYNIPYFQKMVTDEVINLVLFHHNPKNISQKILQLADWLSSAERIKDETQKEMYYKTPLVSVFNQISISESPKKDDYQYQLFPLAFDKIFPEKQVHIDDSSYKRHIEDFLKELKYIDDFEKLYFLSEKYFTFVPAQTSRYKPDISLFDHSKTTAAIAVCLYEDFVSATLNETDINEAVENNANSDKKAFVLIGGDLSGIQNFIFNIPSERAARSLKGRSVYLELLTRYIARYILDRLNLPITNLLYNGGGNFYILAPYSAEKSLDKIRKEIVSMLLDAHKGEIYMAISWLPLTISEIEKFPKVQERLYKKIGEIKAKRWSEIGIADNYEKIFGPIDEGTSERYCKVCGSAFNLIEDEEGSAICKLCNSFKELASKVKKAKFMTERKIERSSGQCAIYNDIFHSLGYEVDFVEDDPPKKENVKIYKLNDFDFHKYDGFLLGSYNLPDKDFDEIANTSGEGEFGDNKLAYLKLDVDNLGKIFKDGLPKEKRSISRIATLSRMFALYFEGYTSQLIKKMGLEESLYVVFSGGDDTFIIGAWDKVLYFLKAFRKDFKRFVGNNPDITFSAGVGIFDTHYPVSRGSNVVEEQLEKAKGFKYREEEPTKNKLTLFDEVFNWDEYDYIDKIWGHLKKLIVEKPEEERESRAILQKVIRSSKGLNSLLKDADKGKIEARKVWRLAYYLRDMKSKEDKEKLVDIYEKMVLKHMFERKEIKNPMIIPVAARLAELSTKRGRKDEGEKRI